MTSAQSIRALAAQLAERRIDVDVLVNNAAILLDEGVGIIDLEADDLRNTFETNVFGAVAVAQAFVPGMVARRYGRIVNVSSEAGQLASMGTHAPAYSMSKAALNAFTRQLAAAMRGSGVLVNSACPGWVRTDMGGPGAPRSVQEGADTIVWLATLGSEGTNRRLLQRSTGDHLVATGTQRHRDHSTTEAPTPLRSERTLQIPTRDAEGGVSRVRTLCVSVPPWLVRTVRFAGLAFSLL